MHYQREGLPSDVLEVFFSDRFYYAASVERRRRGRGAGFPLHVGAGDTLAQAIEDMRALAHAAGAATNGSGIGGLPAI